MNQRFGEIRSVCIVGKYLDDVLAWFRVVNLNWTDLVV